MLGENAPVHVCLSGLKVSNDWPLIRQLRESYAVTVMQQCDVPAGVPLLATATLLVLDCSEDCGLARTLPAFLKEAFPELGVVLVDGGLSQRDIAAAFREGVKDYFAYPYSVQLLVERIHALCAQSAQLTRVLAEE